MLAGIGIDTVVESGTGEQHAEADVLTTAVAVVVAPAVVVFAGLPLKVGIESSV